MGVNLYLLDRRTAVLLIGGSKQTVGTLRRFFNNQLRVCPSRQIWLKAAVKLDFRLLSPDRVKSDFSEGWHDWKPPWAGDSYAIGSRIV